MKTTRHHAGISRRLAAVAVGAALLASCGSSETTSPRGVTATDAAGYTIVDGDTLSGIAVLAGVSVNDLVTANGWSDGADHLILPGDVIKLPQGASSAPPASPLPATTTATTSATTASGAAAASGDYEPSDIARFASLDANQKSDPILSPLPDGQYWSWDYTSDGENVRFTLVQYFYGDACREQFGTGEDACSSDNNTLYTPNASVKMTDAAPTSVIACCDGGSFQSYRVSTSEFARLVAGRASAPDAPAGFSYAPYGVMVTVRNGQAVAADQVFTS